MKLANPYPLDGPVIMWTLATQIVDTTGRPVPLSEVPLMPRPPRCSMPGRWRQEVSQV